MANLKVQKIVNKLKSFFTNHGEKVAVGFGATLFVVGAASAILKPTITVTPEQIKTSADSAKKNIDQPQAEADIVEALANDGIKDLSFPTASPRPRPRKSTSMS